MLSSRHQSSSARRTFLAFGVAVLIHVAIGIAAWSFLGSWIAPASEETARLATGLLTERRLKQAMDETPIISASLSAGANTDLSDGDSYTSLGWLTGLTPPNLARLPYVPSSLPVGIVADFRSTLPSRKMK